MNDAVLDSRGGQLLVSVAAGGAGVAGSYAATGYSPAFLASPIERTLARQMPGALISFAITTLGSLGQQLNLVSAIGLAGAMLAVGVLVAIRLGNRIGNQLLPALGSGSVVWLVSAGATGEPFLALGAALPAAGIVGLGQLLDAYRSRVEPISSKRRRAMSTVGAALGATALGYSAGQRQSSGSNDAPPVTAPGADLADIESKLATARERSFDIDGLDPLVSDGFFEVDINSIDPDITADEWSLTITGAVEEDVTIGYDELREMDAVNTFSTLRCVGDSLNGKKIDTALWTGVPLQDVLSMAGVDESDCDCVMLRAEDDYEVAFPIEAFNRGFAVYGMNGNVLPRGHGYPVRAVIPGHWGEVNTKWLSEIEVLERETDGYWEERGWEGTGPVKPTATLHHDEVRDDGRRLVAGHAYGGLRGVSAVEVSTDGGETWNNADLSEALPAVDGTGAAEDAWQQWQFTYEPPEESHTVVVRMIDGNGTVQTEEETGPYPTGPSGWVSKKF